MFSAGRGPATGSEVVQFCTPCIWSVRSWSVATGAGAVGVECACSAELGGVVSSMRVGGGGPLGMRAGRVRGATVGELRGRFRQSAVSGYMDTIRSATKPSAVQLDGPLLRPEEAARLLAVKTNWIYEAVRAGRLPCLRLGRHIRFTRAMLEGWLGERLDE